MTYHSPRMTPQPPGHSLSCRYSPLGSGSSFSPEGQWKEAISLHSQPRPGNFPSGGVSLSYVWLKWKDCRHTNLCGVLSRGLVYFPGYCVWNQGRPLGDLYILTTQVVVLLGKWQFLWPFRLSAQAPRPPVSCTAQWQSSRPGLFHRAGLRLNWRRFLTHYQEL